ncbi:MAG: pirin family protein [Saprospiraceae bacterium]
MKKQSKVLANLYAQEMDMGGITIRQPFPNQKFQQLDPFLLLHHGKFQVAEHAIPAKTGVGPHPHRGFSPVTFLFSGGIHHRDSRGNNQTVYSGGTQWMNAGMGIIHSERPPLDIHEHGSEQELIQLWINSPAKHKMDQPSYYPLLAEDTPTFNLPDDKGKVRVVAGNVLGIQGSIPSLSPIQAAMMELKAGAKIEIGIDQMDQALIYLLDGKINVEEYGLAEALHAVVFEIGGNSISFEAKEDTRLLFVSGRPLDEPVVSHGPFVMNNQTEILEAMRDYQIGKMGVLIED